jgi:hypothetical protein
VPAVAADNSAEHSPEFLKWYALATRTGEALAASNTWEVEHIRQGKERPQDEYPISLHWKAMHALEEALFARPVRSWVDVGELAIIAFYWGDGGKRSEFGFNNRPDPALDKDAYPLERASAHLVHAVLTMAKGGANV